MKEKREFDENRQYKNVSDNLTWAYRYTQRMEYLPTRTYGLFKHFRFYKSNLHPLT